MQLPIKFTAIFAMVFAAICVWFAIDGFFSPPGTPDADPVSGGRDFAWFWSFLAVVGFAIAWLSWKIGQGKGEDGDA